MIQGIKVLRNFPDFSVNALTKRGGRIMERA
jgi:hypothetical protein